MPTVDSVKAEVFPCNLCQAIHDDCQLDCDAYKKWNGLQKSSE